MGRYLQESYDKALREIERLREERDALADENTSVWETLIKVADMLEIDPEAARKVSGKPSEVYASHLARRDARMKADAMHEAICDLESEFDPCHPLIERLEAKEAEYRRQVEEG